MTRTQVAIVGAGPAGLTLAQLLHVAGIDSVVLEVRSREYVEARMRAGVLEHDVAELFARAGVGERMRREGLVHTGVELQSGRERHRIAFDELAGKTIVVYGQTEVVKDLIAARLESGPPLLFEVGDASLHGLESERPCVRYAHDGAEEELECDFVAGCDGFHGISRPSIPPDVLREYHREYPYGWLGILAAVPPSSEELVYAHTERGFALLSMRSPDVSRLYLQCAPDEDLELWPDERIWEELQARLGVDGWTLQERPILEKGVTPMRSVVVEPMQWGRLFLAGDAAHIVPPTGAKGLNLAVRDVAAARRGARRLVPRRPRRAARLLFRDLSPAGVACRALLVVDDDDAPPRPRRRRVHVAAPAVPASLPPHVSRGRDVARGELRRGRARLTG